MQVRPEAAIRAGSPCCEIGSAIAITQKKCPCTQGVVSTEARLWRHGVFMPVLSHQEIDEGTPIQTVGVVDLAA